MIEALAWHCPQSFAFIKDLDRAGLLEIVGSAFSQNVMPFFEDRLNLRQINDELALLRRHLGWDPAKVKVFWVPERVWDTDKLASVLRSPSLLNGGYRYVLLDDRLLYPWGGQYAGSPRERFDRERPLDLEAYMPWEIAGSGGLVVLPISRDLRYAIPPATRADLERLEEILRWLAASRRPQSIAVYGDDLEKAAGVGGWDPQHPERYDRFLRFLRDQKWVRPVLISDWGADAVARRRPERRARHLLRAGAVLECGRRLPRLVRGPQVRRAPRLHGAVGAGSSRGRAGRGRSRPARPRMEALPPLLLRDLVARAALPPWRSRTAGRVWPGSPRHSPATRAARS